MEMGIDTDHLLLLFKVSASAGKQKLRERKHFFLSQNRTFANSTTTGALARSLSETAEIHVFFASP